jgi:hypothetical protein
MVKGPADRKWIAAKPHKAETSRSIQSQNQCIAKIGRKIKRAEKITLKEPKIYYFKPWFHFNLTKHYIAATYCKGLTVARN